YHCDDDDEEEQEHSRVVVEREHRIPSCSDHGEGAAGEEQDHSQAVERGNYGSDKDNNIKDGREERKENDQSVIPDSGSGNCQEEQKRYCGRRPSLPPTDGVDTAACSRHAPQSWADRWYRRSSLPVLSGGTSCIQRSSLPELSLPESLGTRRLRGRSVFLWDVPFSEFRTQQEEACDMQ
ncbi:hypothetical protein GW17_00027954, partial [Ensete ventricosum]